MTVYPIDPAEVLLGAATLIETRGLCQGSYVEPGRPDGAVCVLAAINLTATGHPKPGPDAMGSPANEAAFLLAVYLRRQGVRVRPHTWSDERGRTAGEVVAALRGAAAMAAAGPVLAVAA